MLAKLSFFTAFSGGCMLKKNLKRCAFKKDTMCFIRTIQAIERKKTKYQSHNYVVVKSQQ